MKKKLLLFIILLTSHFIFSQQKEYKLDIQVTGKFSSEGYLQIHLYNVAKDFLKKPYKTIKIEAKNSNHKAVFHNVPKGIYAVFVVNDKNKNNKLDKNFIGMPKEAMGCSNGAKGRFGPPKFKDAKFNVQRDTTILVKIKKIF